MQNLPTIESKVEMAVALKGQVVACILNSHGNHVVQCCITHIPMAENGHSIEFMLEVGSQAAFAEYLDGPVLQCWRLCYLGVPDRCGGADVQKQHRIRSLHACLAVISS